MNTKNIFAIGAIIIALFASPLALAAVESPGELVVSTIDAGLKILNDPAMQGMNKFQERKQKIWDLVQPVFDFEETSKRALGRHWIPLHDAQRKEFTDAFVKVLKNIYLGKTDAYQGQKIEFVRELIKGNRAKVQTNFYTVDNKQVAVDLNMHKKGDAWRAYDIIIEGVSIVSNYRGQFNSIISKGSFEELMEQLNEKTREINDVE